MKKFLKFVFITVAVLVVIGVTAAVLLVKKLNDVSEKNKPKTRETIQLSDISNLQLDEQNMLLTWDEVDKAKSYKITVKCQSDYVLYNGYRNVADSTIVREYYSNTNAYKYEFLDYTKGYNFTFSVNAESYTTEDETHYYSHESGEPQQVEYARTKQIQKTGKLVEDTITLINDRLDLNLLTHDTDRIVDIEFEQKMVNVLSGDEYEQIQRSVYSIPMARRLNK